MKSDPLLCASRNRKAPSSGDYFVGHSTLNCAAIPSRAVVDHHTAVTSPAIDRMSADERAVFIQMLAAAVLRRALRDLADDQQRDQERRAS